MTGGSLSYAANRREQLQRQLGDIGEVLDRRPRGGGEFPAAGWYARIADELVFLGDHFAGACVTIAAMTADE